MIYLYTFVYIIPSILREKFGLGRRITFCMRRFASPYKGFAQQRPGLAKCGWSEPWE
jgi:hypothetical protein